MSLNKALVLNGPFTLKFIETGTPDTEHAVYVGLKKDAITTNWTEKEGSQDIEDGSTDTWDEGADGSLTITVSEWDTTKIGALEDNKGAIDKIEATFTNKGKVLTVSDPDRIAIEMDDLKLKITVKKSVGAGVKMTDTFVVTDAA